MTSTIVMILFIGFVQWSSPVFEKFMNEDETVEFQQHCKSGRLQLVTLLDQVLIE